MQSPETTRPPVQTPATRRSSSAPTAPYNTTDGKSTPPTSNRMSCAATTISARRGNHQRKRNDRRRAAVPHTLARNTSSHAAAGWLLVSKHSYVGRRAASLNAAPPCRVSQFPVRATCTADHTPHAQPSNVRLTPHTLSNAVSCPSGGPSSAPLPQARGLRSPLAADCTPAAASTAPPGSRPPAVSC